jgi:hypothetical protein
VTCSEDISPLDCFRELFKELKFKSQLNLRILAMTQDSEETGLVFYKLSDFPMSPRA